MDAMLIEIAGIPLEVLFKHSENEYFLRDYRTDKAPAFTIEPTESDLLRIEAELDRAGGLTGIRKDPYPEPFLENNAIHALLAEHLTACHVLLMHGSALCMDGEAYLFTASSGVGKSTHARLWREVFGSRVWMINDDKPMLRISEQGIMVYGTPWNGKHQLSRNSCAPLKAIVQLERGQENRIDPLSHSEAFHVLIQHALTSKKPAVMADILAMEKELLQAVPFYRLKCNTEREAAIVAWRGISGSSQPET